MKASHTPGPWSLDDQDAPLVVICPEGAYVADCGVSEIVHPAEKIANAHLVAAAPALLAALETLVKEAGIDPKDLDPDISGHRPLLAAFAAIAKARGRRFFIC